MISFLEPLYESLKEEPKTMNEVAFYQGYKSDLLEAWEWCQLYTESKESIDLNQAWEIYFAIFKRLSK